MKKILLVLLSVMVFTLQAEAQQRPQHSQYMLNNYLLNPAITGIEDYADIRLSTRRQWVGLDGAPVTYYATVHAPINKGITNSKYHRALAHHGVGLAVHADKTGPLSRTSITGSYAYHMPLTRSIKISAGAAAGLIRNSVNATELSFTNPSDPLASGGDINNNVLDLSLGLWIYSQNFSVGIAGAQLLEDASTFSTPEANRAALGMQRHYFISGSYRLKPADRIDVIPSVMVKLASPSPSPIDASVRVLYDERFWVGASYRHKDALVGMLGVYVSPLLDVSYSYDATVSNLNKVSAGTHEIVVGFKVLNNKRIMCPQWIW
ncbi:PorP/SprF family type IX secretion system membrane protein [Pontibacter arcticus]|uniref:Type IX secretion system membrane protein, PorP/SprF family n=1 Tax=Pontibacter arcticus TaxID=2080288 RepID=A0A364RJ88_9BACT|nr:type IX secretion system membrane protein PorP/SprF [Pontibacter arcticus]RAU84344.1 hypothetical protein DP923_04715 [Pontibacter arcticus]